MTIACTELHRGFGSLFIKENEMNATVRVLVALALLEVLAGCAQLGIPAPTGMTTVDPPMYESSLSD
jgi:hypothetical protein